MPTLKIYLLFVIIGLESWFPLTVLQLFCDTSRTR